MGCSFSTTEHPLHTEEKIDTSKRLQQKTDHVKIVAKQMRNVEAPIIRQELYTPFKGGWMLKVSPLQFAYRPAGDYEQDPSIPFKRCTPPSQTNNFEMRVAKDIKGVGTRKQMGVNECPQVELHHLGAISGFLTVTIKAQAIKD